MLLVKFRKVLGKHRDVELRLIQDVLVAWEDFADCHISRKAVRRVVSPAKESRNIVRRGHVLLEDAIQRSIAGICTVELVQEERARIWTCETDLSDAICQDGVRYVPRPIMPGKLDVLFPWVTSTASQ